MGMVKTHLHHSIRTWIRSCHLSSPCPYILNTEPVPGAPIAKKQEASPVSKLIEVTVDQVDDASDSVPPIAGVPVVKTVESAVYLVPGADSPVIESPIIASETRSNATAGSIG